MFTREMLNIVICSLQNDYPCFVSERHLQTSFIIKAAELFKESEFEFFPEFSPSRTDIPRELVAEELHFDLVIRDKTGDSTIIEFKYKTAEFETQINGMSISLSNQRDTKYGKYTIWSDIERIEKFVLSNNKNLNIRNGFVLFLTNNFTYLNPSKRIDDTSRSFSLHEDSCREKGWPERARVQPKYRRTLHFEYKYDLQGRNRIDYSFNGSFKLLIVEIPSDNRWSK